MEAHLAFNRLKVHHLFKVIVSDVNLLHPYIEAALWKKLGIKRKANKRELRFLSDKQAGLSSTGSHWSTVTTII